MSLTKTLTGWVALAGLLVSVLVASSSSYAGTIFPSVPDAGSPYFFNGFSLRGNKGNWNITGKGGFSFYSPSLAVGQDGSFKITAKFDKNTGEFSSGSLIYKGAIPSLGITSKNTVLFTADLSTFGFDSTSAENEGDSLAAFGINNFTGAVCDMGYCSEVMESVYLYFTGIFNSPLDRVRLNGDAVTTVPLPAALWLLGSGLAVIGATVRRRKSNAAV